MTRHDQFAEDLTLYAMGSLQGKECSALEGHLEECAECRRELDALRSDIALLALSSSASQPPPRARQRLLSSIAKEPHRVSVRKQGAWWSVVASLATVGIVLIALVLWRQDSEMRRRIRDLAKTNAQQELQLQHANQVLATLTDPSAARFTLSSAKTPPHPQGKAIYARNRGSLIFLASNMPALPPEKAYELWLIPTSGAPIPAGIFTPDAHGSAAVINPPLPVDVEAKAFAVTVEPKTGSPAPTSQPMMVGAGA